MSSNHESPSVAVERALAMLEAVAQEPEGLSNAEISRKLQMPKSSASYILRTLETQGYLNRDEGSGKYRVGLKILSLSRGALSGIDVREVALPIMRHLVEQTNLTCHLAILDGPEAVYIEKVEPTGFIRMDTWVGRRMRVHATSVGKALVAHIPQERLEKIIGERPMEKRTPKTITTFAKTAEGSRESARARLRRRRRGEQHGSALCRRPGLQSERNDRGEHRLERHDQPGEPADDAAHPRTFEGCSPTCLHAVGLSPATPSRGRLGSLEPKPNDLNT